MVRDSVPDVRRVGYYTVPHSLAGKGPLAAPDAAGCKPDLHGSHGRCHGHCRTHHGRYHDKPGVAAVCHFQTRESLGVVVPIPEGSWGVGLRTKSAHLHCYIGKAGDNFHRAARLARNSCAPFFRRYYDAQEEPRGSFDQNFVSCP